MTSNDPSPLPTKRCDGEHLRRRPRGDIGRLKGEQ